MKTKNDRQIVIHFLLIFRSVIYSNCFMFLPYSSAASWFDFLRSLSKPELRNHETLRVSTSLFLDKILTSKISSPSLFVFVQYYLVFYYFRLRLPGRRLLRGDGRCVPSRFLSVKRPFCQSPAWVLFVLETPGHFTPLRFLFHPPSCSQTQNGFNTRRKRAFDRFSFTFHHNIVDFVVVMVYVHWRFDWFNGWLYGRPKLPKNNK